MFPSIDIKKLNNKPKFELCRPYPMRNKISNLIELDNIQLKLNLGKVHELSFDMPFYVDIDNKLVRNPLIEKFEAFYEVRMTWNGMTEYFVYMKGNRKIDNSGQKITYSLYSYPYTLMNKRVVDYEEIAIPLVSHLERILEAGEVLSWEVDHIDPALSEIKGRSFSVTDGNVLQSIYGLAEAFGAVIIFDSERLKISLYSPESIGLNKGITFKPATYLESLGYDIKYEDIVTRLYAYGSEGLTFRRLSPTGINYIESLDWLMYPFEQNSNGVVIKHSKWLTDELCIAYKAYQDKIRQYTPTFETLTSALTEKEDEITQINQEIANLTTELREIEERLWVINKTYMDEAPSRQDWKDEVALKQAKELEITEENAKLSNANDEANSIIKSLDKLECSLSIENNMSEELIIELNARTKHGTYRNDSITDEQDLLDEAVKTFREVGQPTITISMDLANFLNDVEYNLIHDRITLGDVVRVKSNEIDVHVELKILEISYNVSNDKITLTITNMKDLRDDYQKLTDTIYDASNTSTVVSRDKFKWDKVDSVESEVDKILNDAWDAALNAIHGGYKNTTILDEWGLKSYDSEDKNVFLFINNGVLGITKSGGNDIEVAITKDGFTSDKVCARIIERGLEL